MIVAALASLVLVAWVALNGIEWSDPRFRWYAIADLGFVTLFLGEFVVELARAPSKLAFLKSNWYDLPGLVPLYAETFTWMRALRILRVVRILRLLRLVHAFRRLRRSVGFVNRVYRASHLQYTFAISVLMVGVMSLGFWVLERGKNPSIVSFDDALWWAMTTATTVGYGDIAPRTGAGRLLASCLMLFGIGLVGVVASSLSTAIYRVGRQDEESPRESLRALIDTVDDLVTRRERGEITVDEYQQKRQDLIAIAKIKTED